MNFKAARKIITTATLAGNDIYITSDIHAYQKNICFGTTDWKGREDECRKFDNPEQMTDKIVNNINEDVKEQDVLICLGDWSFGGKANIPLFRSRINCKHIIYILGNHDDHIRENEEYQKLFSWCGDYLELRFSSTRVILFHYPIAIWDKAHSGSVMLHGHCHGNYQNDGKSIDVGVDTNDLRPYLLTRAVSLAASREFKAKDHHTILTP